MSYVYQQQANANQLHRRSSQPIRPGLNHNYRSIGTTTTDQSGFYTLTWAPDVPGNYTVYANFAGTNGYWPSSAETSFNVMTVQPTATPTASPIGNFASNTTLEYGIVALAIVIVIIGAVIALLVTKKHP